MRVISLSRWALGAALVALLVFGAGRWRAGTRHPGEPVRLRLGVQDTAICALPLIANRLGFFEREGLDVEMVFYPSGKRALEGLFKGDVAFATAADLPIALARLERDDFAVFATIGWTERGAWIVAREDRGILAPADLRGKRVATQHNSAVHFFLHVFLARHGMDESDVSLSFMEPAELPAALAEGRIDAFCMRNPYAALAKAAHPGRLVEMTDAHVYRQTFNLVTWKRMLEDEPAVVAALLRALAAAEHELIRRPAEVQRVVVSSLGAQREQEVMADWGLFTLALTLEQSLFVTLEDQARWALTSRPQPDPDAKVPNFIRSIDIRPLQQVKPYAVSVIH